MIDIEKLLSECAKYRDIEQKAKENEHCLIYENENQIIIEIIQEPFAEQQKQNKINSEYVKEPKNNVKLRNNKARTKTKTEYLFKTNKCNYCITMTFEGEKYQNDPNLAMKAAQNKINYFRNYYGVEIFVDLVPQKGKRGKRIWHIHSPAYIQDIKIKYHGSYRKAYRALRDYLEKSFGYCKIKPLKAEEQRKKAFNYVTGDIYSNDVPYGKHTHSPSRGLKAAEPISKEKALDLIGDREPNKIIQGKYNNKKRYIIQK